MYLKSCGQKGMVMVRKTNQEEHAFQEKGSHQLSNTLERLKVNLIIVSMKLLCWKIEINKRLPLST